MRRLAEKPPGSDGKARVAFTWIGRSGQRGEFEELAVAHNVLAVGWRAVGDLAAHESPDAIRSRVVQAYPSGAVVEQQRAQDLIVSNSATWFPPHPTRPAMEMRTMEIRRSR
jgi:hypothetical protein